MQISEGENTDNNTNNIKNSGFPNFPNARPRTLTREDAIKGGKQITLKKKLARRKNCKPKCPIYPCWAEPLSDTKFEGRCALNQFPKRIQERTLDYLIGGEYGAVKQLLETLLQIGNKAQVEDTLEALRAYFRDQVDFIKVVYGDKRIQQIRIDQRLPIEIMIDVLKEKLRGEETE